MKDSLLNSKSAMLDPNIPNRFPHQPAVGALGTDPTDEKVATEIKATINVKAVWADGLPMELLNSDFCKTGPASWSSTDLEHLSGARKTSHSSGKTLSLPYPTRRTTRRIEKTASATCSCPTWVRCSLIWLPVL